MGRVRKQTHDEIAPIPNQPTYVPFISNGNVPNNASHPDQMEHSDEFTLFLAFLYAFILKPVTPNRGHKYPRQRSATKTEQWRTEGKTSLRRCLLRHTNGISLGFAIRWWLPQMSMPMVGMGKGGWRRRGCTAGRPRNWPSCIGGAVRVDLGC